MSNGIYIVGEAWGEHEEREGRAFVGPSGSVLDSLLRQVGIERRECVLDNVFNLRPPGNDVEHFFTKEQSYAAPGLPPLKANLRLRSENLHHVRDLRERILAAQPNIVLALGATPLWALAGLSGIKNNRGSPMLCSFAPIKLLGTYHPAAILRQWKLRPVVFMDLCKVKEQAAFPEFHRPQRFITINPSLADIEEFYWTRIEPAERVSCDIETKGRVITEVGFAPDPHHCLVIPFFSRSQPDGNYWRSFEEELAAWNWVRRICEEKELFGQNFQYDAQYFLREMGIPVPKWKHDTMLLTHAMQPELEKGLGFLGSIYTNEPPWKFMRADHDTLKKED